MRALLMWAVASTTLAAPAWFLGRLAVAAEIGEPTAEIETLVRKADFDAAERAAQDLLRSGVLAGRDVARVYLQLGIIAAARRDSSRAAEAFRNALRLDPDLTLHASAGPHVTEAFARAKTSMPPAASLVLVIALSSAPGSGDISVEAAGKAADDSLARRVSVRIGELREARDLGPDPIRFSFPLPASLDGCATATASILDEFGNELWPAVATKDVCRPPPAGPLLVDAGRQPPVVATPEPARLAPDLLSTATPTTKASDRPVPRTVWFGMAITGAAAVGATVLGIVALERRDDYNGNLGGTATSDQLPQLRERALTAEHRATAGAIVTGVLAAATAVLYIRGRF